MKHVTAALILCGGIALLASACATKEYVRNTVGTSESKTPSALRSETGWTVRRPG